MPPPCTTVSPVTIIIYLTCKAILFQWVFFWAIWKKSTSVCWLGLLATEYSPGHLEVNVVTTLIMLDLRLAISQIMFHCSKWPSYVNTFWHEDFKEVYFFCETVSLTLLQLR